MHFSPHILSFILLEPLFSQSTTNGRGLGEEWVQAMDKQQVTGLALLDISAAFDTIDHSKFFSIVSQHGLVFVVRHIRGFHQTCLIGRFLFNAVASNLLQLT